MNILYDYQVFSWQKFGGISRYFVELMSRIAKTDKIYNPTLLSENVYWKDCLPPVNTGLGFSLPKVKGYGRATNFINSFAQKKAFRKGSFDIFHPTYYNPYFHEQIKSQGKPYVITVYDMIHEKFPQYFQGDITPNHKQQTITQADKIIAISQQTKKDIMDIYGLPDSKIDVVYLGHSVNNNSAEPIQNLPHNYILFVGQRDGYKNFDIFLKAFAIINQKYPDVYLVCTGTEFHAKENEEIQKLKISEKIKHYFVSDAQLTYLYQHAICFVYPSLYEGFGIPILEAYAASCPVALSNTSCFPEVAREGGQYFDPYEPESIADSIINLIEDRDLRNNKIELGKKVLAEYSWDKMAEETREVYKSLL